MSKKNRALMKYLLLLLAASSSLFANEGKEVYTTYCSACHGLMGEGVKGAAPPLAQSEFVSGDPERITKILLYGLQGAISLHGEKYDLVMPPQISLSDSQIAKVASYVRANWGNTGEEVKESTVTKVKESLAQQVGLINAAQLIKDHKFTNQPVQIQHLISEVFPYIENLEKLTEHNSSSIEEENSGFLSPSQLGKKHQAFSGSWSGTLKIPKDGQYYFSLHTDHHSILYINGEPLIKYSSEDNSPKASGLSLPAGDVSIELRYSHKKGSPTLCRLFWSGPGFDMKPLHSTKKPKKKAPVVELTHINNRAIVHRNFLNKPGYRAFGIGYLEGVNLIFSTEHLNLEQIWQGKFLNAGATWDGRGKGNIARPLSKKVTNLESGSAFKALSDPLSDWSSAKPINMKFQSYEYNSVGHPVLKYSVDGIPIQDHITPSKDGTSFTRTITFPPTKNSIYLKVAPDSAEVEARSIQISKNLSIQNISTTPLKVKGGIILPLDRSPITLEYLWK